MFSTRVRTTSEYRFRSEFYTSDQTVLDYIRMYDHHEFSVSVLLGDAKIFSDWNIYAFPTCYMLDSQQRVARRDLGYSTLAGLWWRTSWID